MDSVTAEKLYETCYMKVYSYVMTLVREQNAASEITQETFFKAISTKQTFRGESECYSWLCAIAKLKNGDADTHSLYVFISDEYMPDVDGAEVYELDGFHVMRFRDK